MIQMHPSENKSCYDPEKQDSKKGLGKLGLSDYKHQVRTGKSWFPNRCDIYMTYRKVDLTAVLSKARYVGVNQGLGLVHLSFLIRKKSLPFLAH